MSERKQTSNDLQLSGITLFQSLSGEELAALSRRCSWRTYPAGRQIVGYQEQSQDVFFVVSGRVRVTIYSLDGKEVSYRDISAGEMFGELAAIDGQMRSANVIAITECVMASLPPDVFWEVLHSHPTVTADLLRLLTSMIRLYSGRIFEFSTLAVKNRIHAELLRLARAGGVEDNQATITPSPKHAEVASRISTHREAVTRELNELTRAGLIERRGGGLQVLDVNRLQEMVDDVVG